MKPILGPSETEAPVFLHNFTIFNNSHGKVSGEEGKLRTGKGRKRMASGDEAQGGLCADGRENVGDFAVLRM